MTIGYARVSTTAQNLDMQIEALNKAGCEKIYTEKESGVKERPVLKELLSFIRQGDTLVVYKLDRLGRSVRELLAMVDDLREKGISLIALQDNIDATTPGGKMMMQTRQAGRWLWQQERRWDGHKSRITARPMPLQPCIKTTCR